MGKAEQEAEKAYPREDDAWVEANVDRRIGYKQGYAQAIQDAKDWVLKNASKNIYLCYDECSFRGYWANGLAKDLERHFME